MNRELRTSPSKIDPIVVDVIRHKLDGIANEMELTLVRSAFSAIVKEGLDASASLFTVEGETLAQALAIPVHLGALIPMVEKLVREVSPEDMKEGDLYLLNDPYLGGTHLPDIVVMMPIFCTGRVIAISVALTHHQDVGGMAPGSTPTNATEIFQEGLRLPLLKLRDGDEWNSTLLAILERNVRIPDIVRGDLNAQVSACLIGARRIQELAGVYGVDLLTAVFHELLSRSERMTRDALSKIPDGHYEYVDYLDNDGVDLDRRIRISAKVEISAGEMHVDLHGSSPEVRGPANCMPSGALAAAFFAVRAVTDPEGRYPNNGGCIRPVRLTLPNKSIMNPTEPAPVGCRASVIKRITGVILGALRTPVPDRVPADSGGEELILHFGGRRADGTSYVTSQILVGGSGAGFRSDGVDVIETDATNCMNIPAEALEMEAPIRVVSVQLAVDSGGAGEWRGGLGARLEYEILEGEVAIIYRGERHYCPADGVNGGGQGGVASAEIYHVDGTKHVIPSKEVRMMKAGERLIIHTAGGGGWGPSSARAESRVREDLANAKISDKAAVNIYRLQ